MKTRLNSRIKAAALLFTTMSLFQPLLFTKNSHAAESRVDVRKIAVTGECSHSATPDRAEITLVASFQDKDVKTAVRKATQAYENTLEAVKKLNLEHFQVETSEYNVHDVREWEKDRSVLKGYEARIGLKVSTSSVGSLGQVTAVAAENGLKDVGQLRMFLSEGKLNAEKASCLKTAADHAKSKAKELAGALGAEVGKVLSIEEMPSGPEPVRPLPMMRMAREERMGQSLAPPTVEGGKQEVSVSVLVVFELN